MDSPDGSATSKLALIFGAAALGIVVATALMCLMFVIKHDRELAARDLEQATKLERIKVQSESIQALRDQLAAVKNWMIAVYERADSHGWDLPPLPREIRDDHGDEEAPLQSAGKRSRRHR